MTTATDSAPPPAIGQVWSAWYLHGDIVALGPDGPRFREGFVWVGDWPPPDAILGRGPGAPWPRPSAPARPTATLPDWLGMSYMGRGSFEVAHAVDVPRLLERVRILEMDARLNPDDPAE